MSLGKIAFGAAILSISQVVRIAAQFVVLPIMAHLLGPSDYGVVAIVMPFVVFSMLISDGGLGSSLIRTGDADADVWSTGFWLAAGFGIVLGAGLVAAAPLVSWGYGDDRLQPLMMTLALVVVLQSLVAVPGAALQKQGRFLALGLCETAAVLAGITTTLTLAFNGFGPWALVGQQLAFWTVRLVFTTALSPFRPRFVFALRRTWPHIIFGRDTMAATMVGFLSRNLDALVIGKVLGASSTGFYALASQFARMPTSAVSGPLYTVAYAHMSQRRGDRALVCATFLALTRLVALLLFPAMGLLAAAHNQVFALILSPKWAGASFIFMLLAPVCAVQAVSVIGSAVMVAYGRTLTQLRLNAEFAALWLVALAVSVSFGIGWVATSYCVAVLLFFPRVTVVTLRVIDCPLGAYLAAVAIPAGVTVAAAMAAVIVLGAAPLSPVAWIALLAGLWLVAVTFGALLQLPTIRAELRLLGQAPAEPPAYVAAAITS